MASLIAGRRLGRGGRGTRDKVASAGRSRGVTLRTAAGKMSTALFDQIVSEINADGSLHD
jgi:hypothetical protein